MSQDFVIRDQIGKTVWSIGGKFPFPKFQKWEIIEAPGKHDNYLTPTACWLMGKLLDEHTGKSGQRPIYCDIPWKNIAYPEGESGFLSDESRRF